MCDGVYGVYDVMVRVWFYVLVCDMYVCACVQSVCWYVVCVARTSK